MTTPRIISLACAALFYLLGYLYTFDSTAAYIEFFIYLFFCIMLIWYGDELGSITGVKFGHIISPVISKASPGSVVRFLGWCLLVIPLAIFIGRLVFSN